MIDVGKVADLVLLMIDGSFGFEMASQLVDNILNNLILVPGDIRVSEHPPVAWLPQSHRHPLPPRPHQKSSHPQSHKKGSQKALLDGNLPGRKTLLPLWRYQWPIP
jgi:hypothetical protein